MDERKRNTVVDANGGRYALGKQLGQGGQGIVYTCRNNPRVAVKIIRRASREHAERLRQQIAYVKRLDLEGLPIARPIAMLASPDAGYVMELITGMVPVSELTQPPRNVANVRDWYISTGGLQRRLQLLRELARVLSDIHGRGLVYGDPSPANILIPKDSGRAAVYLIDADNLDVSSRPDSRELFTPGYGAPELVRAESGINSLTDAHAFSVIAFQVLALCHPLIGDDVDAGEPSLEEAALSGEMPWIDHPTDDGNRSSNGIPRQLLLSPIVTDLFQRTFDDGLNAPARRPGLSEWFDALRTASSVTVPCDRCGWSYYFTAKQCPICSAPRARCLMARIGIWDPESGDHGGWCTGPNKRPLIVGASIGTQQQPLIITGDQLGFDATSTHGYLTAGLTRDRIEISQCLPDSTLMVASKPGEVIRAITDTPHAYRLSTPSASLYVHCGELSSRHRLVQLSIVPEATP